MTRFWLGVEFILLCVVLPGIIIAGRLAPYMFFFLWSVAGYCLLVDKTGRSQSWRDVWQVAAVNWLNLKGVLARWVVCSIGMAVFVAFYDPDRFFALVRERPLFVPILMIIYPVLSALPQEFIFCHFFFRRYKPFFPTDRMMIIASAVTFAWAHVLFINWVAPVFSFVAGLIFACTYAKTRSLALVTLEHGLYGNVLFIVGLGWYFYGGAVH